MNPDGGAKPFRILLVEDNIADVLLVREALDGRALNYELYHMEDGEKAIQFIQKCDEDESAPCPDLLLLDLNLPKREGEEILQEIKRSRRSSDIPVIIFTSSDSPADRARGAALGATRYFWKPSDFQAFMGLGEIIEEILRTDGKAGSGLSGRFGSIQ